MTTATATSPAPKPPLAEGETVDCQAGRVVITLQCVRPGHAYTVTVYQGSLRIEDNCCAFDNEADARTMARGYAHLYRADLAA